MAATRSNVSLLEMVEAGETGPAQVNHGEPGISWLTILGFLFLTFNSGMAVYRSNGDWGAISFVVFSYLDLLCLFYCLRRFENGAPDTSPRRGKVKAAVWILTTLLTCAFSYKVVTAMPLPMAVITLVMTGAGLLGIFYGFCGLGERHQGG